MRNTKHGRCERHRSLALWCQESDQGCRTLGHEWSVNVQHSSLRAERCGLHDESCMLEGVSDGSNPKSSCICVPAVFNRRTGPPSTTLPSALTRIRSEALSKGQATPKGLTQNEVGSTGSFILISTIRDYRFH